MCRNAAKTLSLFLILLLAAACSQKKTITKEQLRSQLTSAASLAAEAETFIDYVRQNRLTRNYAEGHMEYLADEVKRSAKELREETPGPGTQSTFREYLAQLDSLYNELTA